jgi:type II secretion system protein N
MKSFLKLFPLLKKHKGKFLLFWIFLFVWVLILFPFSDLSDLVSSKISEMTQNQLFVQFAKLRISIFPTPGIQFGNFSADHASIGTIEADELTVAPSIFSAFSKTPGGTVIAKGIFKGDIEVTMKSGTKAEGGNNPRQRIEVSAKHLNLQDLKDLGQLPLAMKGNIDIETTAQTDLTFQDQPDADFLIKADHFELPSQTVNTQQAGPINIPDIRMGTLEIKGKLSGGKLILEDGKIGKEGDDIFGSIKGDIGLLLQNQNGIRPNMGAYSFTVDLTIKSSLEEKLSLFLGLISQFKTAVTGAGRYQLKLSGMSPNAPPSFNPIR